MYNKILDYIDDFKIKYGEEFSENFFMNGGCFIFASILKAKFGGTIYHNGNHCILRQGQFYFDIEGERNKIEVLEETYSIIDEEEQKRFQNYLNF